MKYKIICLCGSQQFILAFQYWQLRFTLDGYIVLSTAGIKLPKDEIKGLNERLRDLHFAKIDLADEIFVINVAGYIGESTREEIQYALSKNKIITYMER